MQLTGRRWQIATGQTDLSPETIRAYRDLFASQGYVVPPLGVSCERTANASAPCRHLGDVVAKVACSCSPNTQIKVRSCALFGQCVPSQQVRRRIKDKSICANVHICHGCPDSQEGTEVRAQEKEMRPRTRHPRLRWLVGVTTAPRKDPTLRQSIESLLQAGWSPVVFAEPGTDLSGLPGEVEIVSRPVQYGCWHNWREMSRELLLRDPTADAIMTVQDDTIFHRQSLDYCDATLWPEPPEQIGFVSLYTPKHYSHEVELYDHRGELQYRGGSWYHAHSQASKWAKTAHPWRYQAGPLKPIGLRKVETRSLWGACALVFPRESLRRIIEHPISRSWKGAGRQDLPPHEIRNSDTAIGQAIRAKSNNLSMWWYVPSLAEHVARHSTLGHGDNSGKRGAPSFAPSIDLFETFGEQR